MSRRTCVSCRRTKAGDQFALLGKKKKKLKDHVCRECREEGYDETNRKWFMTIVGDHALSDFEEE